MLLRFFQSRPIGAIDAGQLFRFPGVLGDVSAPGRLYAALRAEHVLKPLGTVFLLARAFALSVPHRKKKIARAVSFVFVRAQAIDVRSFIPPDKIDPRYYAGKNWYITPDGPAALRPFSLLYRTMEEQDVTAFAQIVTGGHEQLLLLRPLSGILIGTYVNFSEDVKPMEEFRGQVGKVDVSAEELKLAKAFAESMTETDFDLSQYKDEFEGKVRQTRRWPARRSSRRQQSRKSPLSPTSWTR